MARDRRGLLRLTQALLDHLGLQDHLELALVDDAAMAALAARSLGAPAPTNVLAFPTAEGLGQIVLNLDALEREAFLYHQPLAEHLLRLLAHALLHLAGHDHGPAMEALTEDAVRALHPPA